MELLERYGEDIARISREVAREFAAPSGRFGHGYEVVSAEDIEQAVYEQFLGSGVTAEDLDVMDSPQAYIRTTARFYGATNEARARRRAVLVAFSDEVVTPFSGTRESPETHCVVQDSASRLQQIVVGIVSGIDRPKRQRVARLCYLAGLDSFEIAKAINSTPEAVRKCLQRVREQLGPEEEACLRAWREFSFPEAKRLPRIDATPQGVLEITAG